MKKLGIFLTMLVMFGMQSVYAKDSDMTIHAIECGVQGDATLVESSGKYLLMDTCVNESDNKVLSYLDANNVETLDLYVSHYHADHYGKIMDILNNDKYKVEEIYLPSYVKNDSFVSLVTAKAMEKNIKITYLEKGSHFEFGTVSVDIIGPLKGILETEDNLNNLSLIAKITSSNTTFLTAGDIQKEQEELLIADQIDVKADIMKLSHHGGSSSNTLDFIKMVNPTFAYYQYYGENEKSAFAKDEWIKNGISKILGKTNILSTGYNGNIKYEVKNDDIVVSAERNTVKANVSYIDINKNEEIKAKSFPVNKDTYFILPSKLANYSYVNEYGASSDVISKEFNVKLYYVANNDLTPVANISEEEKTEVIKCEEVDGVFYDNNGNVVTEDAFQRSCKVVANPKTGAFLPIMILVFALVSLVLFFLINKFRKFRRI